jgi:hypothetical protein
VAGALIHPDGRADGFDKANRSFRNCGDAPNRKRDDDIRKQVQV